MHKHKSKKKGKKSSPPSLRVRPQLDLPDDLLDFVIRPVSDELQISDEPPVLIESPVPEGFGHFDELISSGDLINYAELIGSETFAPKHIIRIVLNRITPLFPDMPVDALEAVLNVPMNFDAINSQEGNIHPQNSPISTGTVRDFILEQLTLPHLQSSSSHDIATLRIAAVINGLGRALATKAGDLHARDAILEKLASRMRIDNHEALMLSRENPFLLYIHDEINSHDAALMVVKRAESLNWPPLEFAGTLRHQALLQLKSLRSLNSRTDISAKRTVTLSVDDAFGLYSGEFLKNRPSDDSGWVPDEYEKTDKIMLHIMHILDGRESRSQGKAAPGESRTVRKARMHEKKVADILPDSPEHVSASFLDKAILHIMFLLKDEDPRPIDQKKAEAAHALQKMIDALKDADITISRFADSLLDKELRPGSSRLLQPGTTPAYITLTDLIMSDKPIRADFPGIPDEISQHFFLPRTIPSQDPDEIAFTPFLIADSREGTARKSVYPVFRNYKNALFSGKSSLVPERAIFGSLCFDPSGSAHGFDKSGKTAGTYGDVTFVLDSSVKSSGKVIYTNTDRGRGYTNLEAFVCSLFQPSRADPDFIFSEQYLKGKDSMAMAFDILPQALLNFAYYGQPDIHNISQNLEVQIFMDLELSKNHIKEVYFASDVPQDKRDRIQAALSGATLTPDLGHPDIVFYQYTNRYDFDHDAHLRFALDNLYDKSSAPEARTLITREQLRDLLDNPDTLSEVAAARYSGKSQSRHTPGKGKVFNQAIEHLAEYLKTPEEERPYRPERL